MKKLALIIIAIMCIVSLSACSVAEQYFVFGTILEIQTKDNRNVANKIYDYFCSIEKILSPTVEGSDLYRVNNARGGETVVCHPITLELFRIAHLVYDKSDGAYDPSVYPVVRVWGFSADLFGGISHQPPADSEISDLLAVVGLDEAFSVNYDDFTITKKRGYDDAQLDFGGIAKGYVAQKAIEFCSKETLVNLGGNIAVFGKKYTIGVGDPRGKSAYFCRLDLLDGECITTSGDYERYFEYESKRYHHVIDPSTGKPSESGLISVTVVSRDGALGDAVATAVLVLGEAKGNNLLQTLGLKAVCIREDLSYYTVGFEDGEVVRNAL